MANGWFTCDMWLRPKLICESMDLTERQTWFINFKNQHADFFLSFSFHLLKTLRLLWNLAYKKRKLKFSLLKFVTCEELFTIYMMHEFFKKLQHKMGQDPPPLAPLLPSLSRALVNLISWLDIFIQILHFQEILSMNFSSHHVEPSFHIQRI